MKVENTHLNIDGLRVDGALPKIWGFKSFQWAL